MASTYSASLRFDYQAPGDNLNTWGTRLNQNVFQLSEDATVGNVSFSLSGSKLLTVVNGATDEARQMVLNVTGGIGGTITAPAVKKLYLVRNASTGDVIVTAGGMGATVVSGQTRWVWSDGTDFRLVSQTDFASSRLTNVGTPATSSDAATKGYADALAFESQAGAFPGMFGNAGRPLIVNQLETAPQWSLGWQRKSADFNAERGAIYLVNTVGGVVTATLPASPVDGDEIWFVDGGYLTLTQGWATNRLVVARNGKSIMSLAEDMNCRLRGGSFGLSYQSGDWRYLA